MGQEMYEMSLGHSLAPSPHPPSEEVAKTNKQTRPPLMGAEASSSRSWNNSSKKINIEVLD